GGAAPVTLTLPSAAGVAGRVYVVKDEAGAAAARPITVRAQPGQAIDGVASVSIASNYGALQLISSGSQWFIMSGAYTPGASVTTTAALPLAVGQTGLLSLGAIEKAALLTPP